MNPSLFGVSGLAGGGGIKSIQRGTIAITNSNTSATATISPVVTSKTELRFLGSQGNIAGPDGIMVTVALTNSTTVTATRASGASGVTVNVSWELTEWN